MEEFLNQYGQYIICGLTCLISIMVNLLKKRPTVSSLDDTLKYLNVFCIPNLINQAEEKFVSGEEKKAFVIDEVVRILKIKFHHLTTHDLDSAKKLVSQFIESYLNTPQKKEVK